MSRIIIQKQRGRSAKTLLLDAERQFSKAQVEKKRVRGLRQAAEKAWSATLSATDALIFDRTGLIPEGESANRVRNRELKIMARDPVIDETILSQYYKNQHELHGDCFYENICEPRDQVLKRIDDTGNYIAKVKRLIYR